MTRPAGNANELDFCVPVGVEIGPSGGKFTDLNPTLDTRAKDGPIRNQLAGAVITMAHGQGGAEIGFYRGPTPTCNHEAPIAAYQPMVLMDQGGSVMNVEHDMVGTLRRETHGHEPAVIQPPAMQVRRLTPVECERLQGFPDNYTAIPWRKKPASECPDGPRYKALGNSWAVPVVLWIGKRIALALETGRRA